MSEGQVPKRTVLALAAGLLCLFAALGYKFYVRGRAVEAEFTITGRTLSSRDPAVSTSTSTSKKDLNSRISTASTSTFADGTPAVPLPSPTIPPKVVVHVAGAVKSPGVYRLEPESRVEDALKAAGGATSDADVNAINLAARAEDGSRIYFPTKKEAASNVVASVDASTASRGGHPPRGGHAKFSQPGRQSVNINTASAEQLQQLPGVGPSMSARILAHRKENGRFTDPAQLMDVSGIGEKKFEKMKPFVKVR